MEPVLYVKIYQSTSPPLKIDYDYSMTVGDVKECIYKKSRVKTHSQRLIFTGKQLEDGRRLVDYSVQRESTLHFVTRPLPLDQDFDDDDFDWEIRNFARLRKSRRMRKTMTQPELVEGMTRFTSLFRERVCSAGAYGPLSTILSYIDPVELLYNFIYVSKTFYETVMYLYSTSTEMELNDTHYHIFFGRYTYVCEKLFLKLIRFMKNKYGDDNFIRNLRIYEDVPQHYFTSKPIDTCTLLSAAMKFRYLSCVKELLEVNKVGIHPPDILSNVFKAPKVFWQSRLPTDFTLEPEEREILTYMIDNHKGFELSNLNGPLKQLLKAGEWDLVMKLIEGSEDKTELRKDVNFGSGEIYKYWIQEVRDRPVTLKRFLEVKKHVKFDMNNVKYAIAYNLNNFDWELVEYIFKRENNLQDHYQLPSNLFLGLESYPKFYQFAIDHHNELIFNPYLPRMRIYIAGRNKDEVELRRIFKDEYDKNQDTTRAGVNYYAYSNTAGFKFYHLFRTELMDEDDEERIEQETKETIKMVELIRRLGDLEVHYECYLQALKNPKLFGLLGVFRRFISAVSTNSDQRGYLNSFSQMIVAEIKAYPQRDPKYAIQILEENMTHERLLRERSVHYSESYLERVFRAAVGKKLGGIIDTCILKIIPIQRELRKKSSYLFYPSIPFNWFQIIAEEEDQDVEFQKKYLLKLLELRKDFDKPVSSYSRMMKIDVLRDMARIFDLCVSTKRFEVAKKLFLKKSWKMVYICQSSFFQPPKNNPDTKKKKKKDIQDFLQDEKMEEMRRRFYPGNKLEVMCWKCKLEMVNIITDEGYQVSDFKDPEAMASKSRKTRFGVTFRRMICEKCFLKK